MLIILHNGDNITFVSLSSLLWDVLLYRLADWNLQTSQKNITDMFLVLFHLILPTFLSHSHNVAASDVSPQWVFCLFHGITLVTFEGHKKQLPCLHFPALIQLHFSAHTYFCWQCYFLTKIQKDYNLYFTWKRFQIKKQSKGTFESHSHSQSHSCPKERLQCPQFYVDMDIEFLFVWLVYDLSATIAQLQ